MTTYVFRDGRFVNKATGIPMELPDSDCISVPMIQPDISGFLSPIDGKWVEGRYARREHMKAYDVVEAGDRPARGFRSEKFARKHGFKA